MAINATVMLGGLPLSIAALTFNLEMVDMLLSYGAELSDSNDRGDTVFHSLVRFSALYPEKEAKAEKMMKDLHQRLKRKVSLSLLFLLSPVLLPPSPLYLVWPAYVIQLRIYKLFTPQKSRR